MRYWSKDGAYNPFVGCEHISDGCDNCYAEKEAEHLCRMGNMKYARAVCNGKWTGDLHLDRAALEAPLHKRKPRVFFNSMCDPFNWLVDHAWIMEMCDIFTKRPQHTFVLCTKRPMLMARHLSDVNSIPNVYLGVTVESQKYADERLPYLAELAAAGWNTWISYEPALGAIDWDAAMWRDLGIIKTKTNQNHQWEPYGFKGVIAGGESGPNARPAHPDWFRSCRDACADAGIKFALKQAGSATRRADGFRYAYNSTRPSLDGVYHWQLPWEEIK